MLGRVLIAQSGIRITRPGYEVLGTDAWDQVLLDLGVKSGQILAWGIVNLAASGGNKVATFYYGPFSQKPEVRAFAMTNGVLRYPYYDRYGAQNVNFRANFTMRLDVQPSGVNILLQPNTGTTVNPDQVMVMAYRKQYLG